MAEQEIPWLGRGYLVIRPKGFGAFEQFKWGEGNTLWICHINALTPELALEEQSFVKN